MGRPSLKLFDETSSPIDQRIATGLHKLGLAMKQQTWLQAHADGISPTQGQILAALAQDGPLTASELSSRLGITLPTISDSTRTLLDKELVTKQPDPRHPRASLVVPTTAGRAAAARTSAWPEFLAAATATLTDAEKATFLASLLKMIKALQDAGKISLNRMCTTCVYFRPNLHAGRLPHHCDLVDAPMGDQHLRVDCAEHEPAR